MRSDEVVKYDTAVSLHSRYSSESVVYGQGYFNQLLKQSKMLDLSALCLLK